MYTTATVFFKTLANAGVTHAFVNWGSDHPALLEEIQRQKAEDDGKTLVEIVTCPSEYVALNAAYGYAQVTGKPAAVIVHVDVGTQSLAGAIHNVDRGQAPVLIFAGAAPSSVYGELPGTRNEFILWLQDVHDQPAIVRQYMRYTAQLQSGKTASKVMMRALQIATSEPKGPVYLWARREVLDEEVDDTTMHSMTALKKWPAITTPALSSNAVEAITSSLLQAEFPLLIVAHSGRDVATVPLLTWLSSTLAIAVVCHSGSVVCIPNNHPYYLGYTFAGALPHLHKADVVIVLDVDIPWLDVADNPLREGVKVFVIDNDPLKRTFGWSHVDAEMLCTTDAVTALSQINDALRSPSAQESLLSPAVAARIAERKAHIQSAHSEWMSKLSEAETRLASDGTLTVSFVLGALREAVNKQVSDSHSVLWMNEAVSNTGSVWNHIRPEVPGGMFRNGGSSLGWVLGGSIGASMGAKVARKNYELVVAVTGDGNYLFGMPTAAYWVARRYETPFLTVILNNRGWSSPKHSMRGVHPDGFGSRATGERLSVGFGTDNADYAGVAAAAGGAWARRVDKGDEVATAFGEAVRVVIHERRCAVVECVVESI